MPAKKNFQQPSPTGKTPLIQQYNQLKAKHPDTLLLCRVGDFYEAFGSDARKLSEIAEITLTKYANGQSASVDMAGFPYHALDTYIPKLIKAGLRVAVTNQPKEASHKGLIKRDVVDLITPGLSYHDQVLEKKHNNYLAALHFGEKKLGIALLDLSTGEFLITEGNQTYIEKLLQSLQPSEIIFNKAAKKTYQQTFQDHYHHYMLEEWIYHFEYAYEKLNKHFKTTTLKGFGIKQLPLAIIAAGSILYYLAENKHKHLSHINSIARLEEDKYVWLDRFTIRNLELLHPQQEDGTSLIEILDNTVTPMGGRMLRKWIALPLKEKTPIKNRLETVAILVKDATLLEKILHHLKQISDLERLIAKVAAKRINPRELLTLKKALQHTLPIQNLLKQNTHEKLIHLSQQIHPCDFILEKITTTLQPNPPILINQGNLIQKGVHPELDELQNIIFQSKNHLQQLLKKAREKTRIPSLKIGYNKVFGFYLEVTYTHKDKVPSTWIRKQTLVNAERYVTEELKTYEEKILSAQEKMHILEQTIYHALLQSAETFVPHIQQNAKILAELDCYQSFAQQAQKHQYTQPIINESHQLHITAGRHPVIEQKLPPSQKYIPNDVYLDLETQQILLITGPNMAGKSAFLRQVALNVLMAQIGSFIPASQATIGIVDKIFTRVGASDNLAMGESTFMVEMQEMAGILNNLSDRSLVIVDELGRGTSTADGLSLAQSAIEYIHDIAKYKAKTLFATHYHELSQLATHLKRVKNFHAVVKQLRGDIFFLHTLQEGSTPHSFGIHVAKMAGMPTRLINRAKEILANFLPAAEKEKIIIEPTQQEILIHQKDPQIDRLIKALEQVDINTLSPVEALLKLQELKILLEDLS